MATSRVSEVILKYSFDSASISKSEAAAKRIADNVKGLGQDAAKTGALVESMMREVEALGRLRSASELAEDFASMGDNIGDANERAELLLKTLKEIGATDVQIAVAQNAFDKSLKDQGGKSAGILGKVERAAGSAGLSDIGNIAGLIDDVGELGTALTAMGIAVGPLVGVVLLAAGAFASVSNVLKIAEDQANKSADAIKRNYEAEKLRVEQESKNREIIRTRSVEENKQIIDDLQSRINAESELLSDLRDQREAVNQAYTDLGASFNPIARSNLGKQGQELDTAIADVRARLDELNREFQNTTQTLAPAIDITRSAENALASFGSGLGKFVDDSIEALKKADEARRQSLNEQASDLRERIQLDQQLSQLRIKGSVDDVKAAQEANRLKIDATQAELAALSLLEGKTPEIEARIADLVEELGNLKYAEEQLEGAVIRSARARQQEAEAVERLKATMLEVAKSFNATATNAGKLAQGVTDAVLKAGQDRVKLEKDAAADVERINEQALEKRADLEKRYQDRLIDITEQAAESAAKALDKLKQSQVDLKRDVDRDTAAAARKQADDELQARVDFAREDAKAFQDHLTNLRRIREDAQDAEFEQALNRDFASLFFTRRDTSKQLTRANEDFNAERQQRQTELQQRLTDMRVQAAIEARERQIQYQQRLADLRTAYQRETAEIEANRQAQLAKTRVQYAADQAELSANLAKQLQARRAAYRTELDELNKALAAKVKAEFNAQSGIIQGASKVAGIISSIFSVFKTPVKRAGGGPLAAGVLAHVNEPNSSGRETFTTGGHTYGLPQNSLFMSPQAGYVNANKGSSGGRSLGNLSIPITVYESNNPTKTARMIDTRVNAILQDFFGDD